MIGFIPSQINGFGGMIHLLIGRIALTQLVGIVHLQQSRRTFDVLYSSSHYSVVMKIFRLTLYRQTFERTTSS